MNESNNDTFSLNSPDILTREVEEGEDSNFSFAQSDSNTCPPLDPEVIKRSKKSENIKSRFSGGVNVAVDILVEDLYEYQWPPDDSDVSIPWKGNAKESSDWYVIQEVVSGLLQIKSFKRKYPDLFRRVVDGWEKDWLMKKNMLPKSVADMGVTALRSDDVLSLLEQDYPEIHVQVFRLFRERKIQWFADQQKEQYQTSRVEKSSKLDILRKKAVQSAAEYNKSLVQDRRKERQYYWDLQTMQIHVPHNKPPFMNAFTDSNKDTINKCVIGDEYPIAVIPGQFSSRSKRYNNYELFYMPVNTSLYSVPKPDKLKDGKSQANNNEAFLNSCNDINLSLSEPNTPKPGNSPPSSSFMCSICRSLCDNPLKCSECGKGGHPLCLDIKENMIELVRSYNWSCMDCKKCQKCSAATNEEQIMFCDKCDRGFHTFCLGLGRIPEGNWECLMCNK